MEHIGLDIYGKAHTSFYIKTGKDFGITLLDFDTHDAYNNWITLFPECKNYLTQNTKKGFHIFFKYSADFPDSLANAEHADSNCKIDIRSNGGLCVAYPTSYIHHDTSEEYKYEIYNDGELGTITPEMVRFFDDNNMRRLSLANDTKNRLKKEKKVIATKIEAMKVKAGEKFEELASQSGKLFQKMCVCFTGQRVAEYQGLVGDGTDA